jgi:hypothetical protein
MDRLLGADHANISFLSKNGNLCLHAFCIIPAFIFMEENEVFQELRW